MNQFISAITDAVGNVLSQNAGRAWQVLPAPESDPAVEYWLHILLIGNLAGELSFGFESGSGCVLANALLQNDQVPRTYGGEEKEAVEELFRQVLGKVADDLRSRFAELSFEVASREVKPDWEPQETIHLKIACDDMTAHLSLSIGKQIAEALRSRVIDTDQEQLQHGLAGGNLEVLLDVPLAARLRFGSRRMKLREVLELHPGAVIELDRQVQDAVDLLVETKLIARGEVVVVDGNYGLKVGTVINPRQRMESLA